MYSSNGTKLDLSVCDNVTIKVEIPIIDRDSIALTKGKTIKEKEGIDIFNSKDPFFNDICIPYTDENGNDIILFDRKKDIYQNIKICSNGCTYDTIDYSTYKVICQCETSKETQTKNIKENNFLTKINLKPIVCYNLLTQWKYVYNNFGFWFGFIMLISLFIVIAITIVKERSIFYLNLSRMIEKSNPSIKLSTDYFEKRIFQLTSKKMTNTQIPSTKAMTNINDSFYDDIIELKCSYDYLTEKKYIDNNPYTKALVKDYRSCFIIMWEYIREHNLFCRIFLNRTGFDLITLHLSVFIFSLTLTFALNALFFNNEEISNKYNGKLKFADTFLRALYSFLFGVVLLHLIRLLMNYSMMIDTLIVEIKEKQILLRVLRKYLKTVRIRIIIVFVLEIILVAFFWYYMSTFCAVYQGSQIEWFKGGWTSFIITICTSIAISFSVCILRFLGLYYKSKYLYNTSIFFKNIFIG